MKTIFSFFLPIFLKIMSSTVGEIKMGRHGFDITAIGGDGVTSVAHISVAAFGPVDGLCYVRPLFRDKGPVPPEPDLILQRSSFSKSYTLTKIYAF